MGNASSLLAGIPASPSGGSLFLCFIKKLERLFAEFYLAFQYTARPAHNTPAFQQPAGVGFKDVISA